MDNMNFDLFTPTKLLFGCGKLDELSKQKLPGKKALLLISNGKSVYTNGAFDRTVAQLDKAGVEHAVCANIHENPTKEVVMEAAGVARKNNCDFIVALGGGAVLDAAIAVSAMATNPGELWDYVNGGTGKGLPLVNPGLPIVTIATTSGTCSEIKSPDKRKNRVWSPVAQSGPRHSRSGTDEDCSRQIYGLSGIRCSLPQYGSDDKPIFECTQRAYRSLSHREHCQISTPCC